MTGWERVSELARRFTQAPGSTSAASAVAMAGAVSACRESLASLGDGELRDAFVRFRGIGRLPDTEALTSLLAVVVEQARRDLGLDAYPEQVAAAACLLRGQIVDMATGEGKTLVGFLAAGVWGVLGRRVHVLSANEYLATRDAAAATHFFAHLGVSVAAVAEAMPAEARQRGYGADVVYSTAHQVGFDLLRDRRRNSDSERLLTNGDVALVDEIDAVLIDDAAVPLVLAGTDQASALTHPDPTQIVANMQEGVQYRVAGDRRSVAFTDAGLAALERAYGPGVYDGDGDALVTAHVALHARALLHRDVHYTVEHERVRLISETRGRIAELQRWPDGLHAAIERKENLPVSGRGRILDQILVETVLRDYEIVGGMSGSALQASERLAEDLDLETVTIPPHRPPVRIDEPDRLFVTAQQRDREAARRVVDAHATGQPVLIGTRTVRASEAFAALLRDYGLAATVLNAKNDAEEADIIARAGHEGTVTVSTQMAGRGVDIRLSPASAEAGGLLVLGLERYDSPRLDRQLRGRAGRQGDPGQTVFYTSLEDTVMADNLRANFAPRNTTATGAVTDRRFERLYEHAQRVADGKSLQLHRITRKYTAITDEQRRQLLRTRNTLLNDNGVDELIHDVLAAHPERVRSLTTPTKRQIARDVALYCLDDAWSAHLDEMAAVREGIHLRALGRQNPHEEFALIAHRRFADTLVEAAKAVRNHLLSLPDDATDLADLGLHGPTATWTYLVTENPFGSEADRIVAHLGNIVRGGRSRGLEYT